MCNNHIQNFFAESQLTANQFTLSVLLNLIITDLEKSQQCNNESRLPGLRCKQACMEMSVCLQLRVSFRVHSLLFARWLRVSHLIVLPKVAASNCVRVLTMRACFVDEVAEVEQGGPGSQVLNEPLREREREEGKQMNSILLALITTINSFIAKAQLLQ